MFRQSLLRATELTRNVRHFRINAILRDTKETAKPVAESVSKSSMSSPQQSIDTDRTLKTNMHNCSNFDRWMLVWMKKYPSKEQVPSKIPLDTLHKAQSQARIRTANIMIMFTIIGCIWAVVTGKRDAEAGKTLGQENRDWHDRINREYKENLAASTKTT